MIVFSGNICVMLNGITESR